MRDTVRQHQDSRFAVSGLTGLPLEELVGVVDAQSPCPDSEPILVYLKVQGHPWQRFFLEDWMGVWSSCPEIAEDADGDGIRLVDYAALFQLRGALVGSVACAGGAIRIGVGEGASFVLELCMAQDGAARNRVRLERGF